MYVYTSVYRCLASAARSLPRIFLSFGSGDCGRTSSAYQHIYTQTLGIGASSGGYAVVCLPMTSGLGCQFAPGFSQRFRSNSEPRFLLFRRDCSRRNDFSIALDSVVNRAIVDELIGQETDNRVERRWQPFDIYNNKCLHLLRLLMRICST